MRSYQLEQQTDDSSKSVSSDNSQLESAQDLKVQPQKRWLSFLFSNKIPHVPLEDERQIYPMYHVNPISRLFFWWLTPLLKVGYARTLQPEDLYKLDKESSIEFMYSRFISFLEPKMNQLKQENIKKKIQGKNGTSVSKATDKGSDLDDFQFPLSALVSVLFKTFWYECIKSISQVILYSAALSTSPLLQKKLIEFVEAKALGYDPYIGRGIGYAFGVALMIMFNILMNSHGMYHARILGAKFRSLLIKVLLDKSFKLDSKGHHNFPDGKINTIMSTDLNRLDFAALFMPFLFSCPVTFGISLGLLIHNIGASALVGLAVFVSALVLLGCVASGFIKFRKRTNVFTDKRVILIKEILKNFKIIKYYGWEDAYFTKMLDERTSETNEIYKMQVLRGCLEIISSSLPNITSMVSFCVLYAIKYDASVSSLFSSLTLFSCLAQAFLSLPIAAAATADASVGLKRVCEVLCCGETDNSALDDSHLVLDDTLEYSIRVKEASFQWENFGLHNDDDDKEEEEEVISEKGKKKSKKDKKPKSIKAIKKPPKFDDSSDMKNIFPGLNNINLEIEKGEFVVITGSIGSGKSSLLQALSGFMKKVKGSVLINGSLLLCGYPWVQNATIRENITFGSPFDKSKYQTVVEACSLPNDFKQLPGGDMTEVGERGITLSGGQKARINLARAVYAGKDTILMDDVLSAVDAKVGKHIVESCIMGYLKGKTRVLATHQLSLIGSADKVVFLNGDGSIDVGSLQELIERNTAFKKLMEHAQEAAKKKEQESKIYQDEFAITSKISTSASTNYETVKITEDEEMAVNQLSWDVYWTYIKLGSGPFKYSLLPLYIIFTALNTFCSIFSNTWLSFWVSKKYPDRSDHFFIGLYIMFSFLAVTFVALDLGCMIYGAITASKNLNILASKRLMRVPMSYTDIIQWVES